MKASVPGASSEDPGSTGSSTQQEWKRSFSGNAHFHLVRRSRGAAQNGLWTRCVKQGGAAFLPPSYFQSSGTPDASTHCCRREPVSTRPSRQSPMHTRKAVSRTGTMSRPTEQRHALVFGRGKGTCPCNPASA